MADEIVIRLVDSRFDGLTMGDSEKAALYKEMLLDGAIDLKDENVTFLSVEVRRPVTVLPIEANAPNAHMGVTRRNDVAA